MRHVLSEEYDILIVRSVTYAQRTRKALDRAGISCRVFRAPMELSNTGCAYAVRLPTGNLREALEVLRRENLNPARAFLYRNHEYLEAAL